MNTWGRLLTVAVIFFLVDLPWLSFVSGDYSAIVKTIQGGREVRMRPMAAIAVYPALAFLALRTTSLRDAFLTGVAVYAVYDFTVMAVFKEYPLYMALADTLWGGVLFTAVHWIMREFKI